MPRAPRAVSALVEGGENWVPTTQRREAIQRRLLAAGDVIAATLALWLVLTLPGTGDQPALLVLAGMPLVVLVFKIAGLYDRDPLRISHSTLDEAPMLLQLTGLYVLSVTILQSAARRRDARRRPDPRPLGRELRRGRGPARRRPLAAARAPCPPSAASSSASRQRADRIREKLASSGARATVVATFGLEGEDDFHPLDPASVRGIVSDLQVHRIILAPTTADSRGVVELIRIAKAAGARVSVLPRMLEVVGSAVEFDDLDGMTVLGVRQFGLSRSSRRLKRAFDFVATPIGLLAVAPILAALAAAIKLDSRGPVFFRQVRIGRDGVPFEIFKFRSMVVDADAQKDALRDLNEVGDGMFKITADPRVTRVGNFLRRTSLDELPQLFNVLRGRDEPRRPAPARRRRGRAGDRPRPQPAAPDARHDRPVAGPRSRASRCRRWSASTTSTCRAGRSGSTSSSSSAPCGTCCAAGTSDPPSMNFGRYCSGDGRRMPNRGTKTDPWRATKTTRAADRAHGARAHVGGRRRRRRRGVCQRRAR